MGSGAAFVKAYDKQLKLVAAGLPILTWEINCWAMMDGEFDGYPADHDDSLIGNSLAMLSPCTDGSQTPPISLHAELDEPGFSVPNGQEEMDGGLPDASSAAVFDALVV